MQLAQQVILSGDTGGAVIEVAYAQVLAAHCYHRAGAKAKAFGPEDRGLDHIEAGFKPAVGLHSNLAA